MADNELAFKKRLQATFKIEAEEHVRAISSGVLELEKEQNPDIKKKLIENIYREVHSLKGAARVVDLKDIEAVCQPLESVFSALKNREVEVSKEIIDICNKAVDELVRLVDLCGKAPGDARNYDRQLVKTLEDVSRNCKQGTAPAAPVVPVVTKPAEPPVKAPDVFTGKPVDPERKVAAEPAKEVHQQEIPDQRGTVGDRRKDGEASDSKPFLTANTVRIPVSRLDTLLASAEEMTQIKMVLSHRISELKSITQVFSGLKAKASELKSQMSGEAMKSVRNFVEQNEEQIGKGVEEAVSMIAAMEKDQRMFARMAEDQLESMKQVLMLPVSSLLDGFPKFIRDLSREQKKEIEFSMRGTELEVDKKILEEMKDPLIHLIRNCVDHGIKGPKEREASLKPGAGKVSLSFGITEGRMIEVVVSDDGNGIDAEKVKHAAIKAGAITPEKAAELSREEALLLVFHSGVSTSPIITDLSGRGLGLAIVREKIERLGGSVKLTSGPAGTSFRLLLPLSMSTFRGVQVRLYDQVFVIPAGSFKRVVRVMPDEITTVENNETITVDGVLIPIVKLSEVLTMPKKNVQSAEAHKYLTVVVVMSEDNTMGFTVDDIEGEYQYLVKGLGTQLKRVRNYSGAAILGDGKIVPVLDAHDLVRSALSVTGTGTAILPEEGAVVETKKLLVADDSITSRTLIKNILESAGYSVTTAFDGEDAFAQLKEGEFDLLVSDVDMPRLNGFELTARIRADKKFSELPVVLVTALDSKEDKERGIDAGANAYIMKSSFDQSNLLEVVSRLI